MRRRVVAIGLDSTDPGLLQRYMASGVLSRVAELRRKGALTVLSNRAHYAGGSAPQSITEGLWVEFQTGVRAGKNGFWTAFRYDPASYESLSDPVYGGYDYREFAPFYALGSGRRVATLDVPVSAVCDGVDGIQICGWGGHYPFVVRGSSPAGLLEEVSAAYGRNEVIYRDAGVFWNHEYLEWLERASIESVRTRARLCSDLMAREPWDLLLAVFGESHGATHDLWFAGHPDHPVHAAWREAHDPLANVFRAIDRAVGDIADRVPEDSYFVLFSVNGACANVADVATFFLLPELLYRFNFPGRVGFAAGDPTATPSPPFLHPRHRNWYGEIWSRRHVRGRFQRWLNGKLPPWLLAPPSKDFRFPYFMSRTGADCGWMPAEWYQPAWSRMRSFALPAFADGHVRINLRGREGTGIVAPDEYEAECDRVSEFLLAARNARSGRPFVREVHRTRRSAADDDPRLPSADLIAIFDDEPVDVVDAPAVGRVGPVPFYRTGGHCALGFAMVAGPGIDAGCTVADSEAVDLSPTILELLGASVPDRFDGRSWLSDAMR